LIDGHQRRLRPELFESRDVTLADSTLEDLADIVEGMGFRRIAKTVTPTGGFAACAK
jgi:hypothetical protein